MLFETLHREDMHRYQEAGVEFIKDTQKCALFIDMGLGKTTTVLTAVRDLQLELEMGRALVIAPPRVAKKTWPDEIKKWSHLQKITHTSLCCPDKQRRKRMEQASDVHLISIDLVPWLDKETCGNHDYDAIIIDESSMFKSRKAKRWQAVRRLINRNGRPVRYVIIMTGTPAANGLYDLWAQIYLLDHGARLGYTDKDFKERWFNKEYGDHAKPKPKSFASASITSRLQDICFTLRDADYAELPPLINNTVEVEFDDEMQRMYKKFKREFVLELEDTTINAPSASAILQKLQQVANGRIYDRDGNVKILHSYKLDALEEIVGEAGGEPMIVAYSHRHDIDAIKSRFPNAVLLGNNPATIDAWNNREIEMLVMHPKSGGHGLNLQFGGSITAWYGLPWSLELYLQLRKRLHRPGQKKPVIVHHITAKNTIDEQMMAVLAAKDLTQDRFLNSLRRIITDVVADVRGER
jgi:SNF2 family DNA or RNA helicase